VEQYTVAGQVAENGEIAEIGTLIQGSPPQGQWGYNEATPPGSPLVQGIQFATPPSGQQVDSEGVEQRFRTVQNLNDITKDAQDSEYSGLCYFAAEEPASVDEALKEQSWKDAMIVEMNSIQSNKTWELSVLPAGHKAIGLKWIFKVKKDPQGVIIKYKARLVAKGYAQKEGVDFKEVFALVAGIETIRLLIAIAAQRSWEVHHMDVKSEFLNDDLVKEVYV
jgi:hypothetical protein